MSYNEDDLELKRIRQAVEKRKQELEELQREELRMIREREKNSNVKPRGYDPKMDSAFSDDSSTKRQRVYDPDQLVSEEKYSASYEDDDDYGSDGYGSDNYRSYPGESYTDDYDEAGERHYQTDGYMEYPDSSYDDDEYDDEEYVDEDYERRQFEKREQQRREQKMREKQRREQEKQDLKREIKTQKKAQKKADKKAEERRNKEIQKELNKKKKKSHFLRNLIIFLLILMLIFCGAIWNITRRFNPIDTEVSHRPSSMKSSVVNVLLIGQDAREGESGQRSDSMILISINTKKNTVAMTSIMRDTYVEIPGQGGNRINAAYAFGGIDLLDQTIEQNFDVKIDGNAMVDFDGFLEAMTAVGELDMELTADEAAYMNANPGFGSNNDASDEVWNLTEGVNKLTPSQLLAYSRIRHVGNSDWDRTERQRKVISGAVGKVKHGHLLSGYNMAYKAAPSITTDVKTMGMLRIAFGIIAGGDMKRHIIPAEGTYYGDSINGMSVLVPDLAKNQELLKRYIDGEDE